MRRLKSIDFFKKLPSELTEATLTGAWISVAATIVMTVLMFMELWAFASPSSSASLVVDRSSPNELLKVNFNISFPALSCEFAALDVSDTLGTRRLNLTKTVHKTPIDSELLFLGPTVQDVKRRAHNYDEEGRFDGWPDVDVSQPINHFNFEQTLERYPIVVVNFFAPWCHWCQRLEPTWDAATSAVHDKYPESDGRVRLAKVDCVAEAALCQEHFIQAFPSIRVFRHGHDEVNFHNRKVHEAYDGDRTYESLTLFADQLALSAGMPHLRHQDLVHAPFAGGCNMHGFVMAKKVPGTLHFTARSESHTFQHAWTNTSHVIHTFYFGSRPSWHKLALLRRLHPAGLQAGWADKLVGHTSISETTQTSHEHYLQVVLTTVKGLGGGASEEYDAYEYTAHSHSFESDDIPATQFSYDLAPLQILVQETRRPLYHLLTTTSAIVGGVFTVAGILDAMLYQGAQLLRRQRLGQRG
uniref:Thioredoxin domain-containing protein n=1 Tax=Chlamydomonas euryale TaxID=1486919 RepID=A0A7R9YQB2_9CHLO|mmetsp:Transcript_11045/g.32864  ORF Transcript_11045/g.32864 Transcript_11045/m.32864 type:complete len:470 (+) Transcript_11045:264-1673(+)